MSYGKKSAASGGYGRKSVPSSGVSSASKLLDEWETFSGLSGRAAVGATAPGPLHSKRKDASKTADRGAKPAVPDPKKKKTGAAVFDFMMSAMNSKENSKLNRGATPNPANKTCAHRPHT